MSVRKKLSAIGSYFFIFGAIIAVFDLSFKTPTSLMGTKLFILLITSIAVGILNIASEEKYKFMVSSLAFALFMFIFEQVLGSYLSAANSPFIWENLSMMFTDMVLLVLPAGVIVALTELIEIMSVSDPEYHNVKHFYEHQQSKAEKIWNIIIIFAVALAIVIFVLPLTFDVTKYESGLFVLDLIVLAIFIFDLFILFRRSKSVKYFFKHYWLDILAVLPLFQAAKLIRVSRIIKIATRSSELSKVTHVGKMLRANQTMKYFSAEKNFRK